MKKLNLKSIGEKLSKEQMKNVTGGCGGYCGGQIDGTYLVCSGSCRCFSGYGRRDICYAF